jgi:ferrochelatase
MADGCRYESQLRETSARVAEAIGHANWRLAFQSRSGPPSQPWLAPDVCDYLRQTSAAEKITHAVIAPIGFLSDHVEVLYDLDVEARDVCKELGVEMIRAATINDHPKFIALVRDLIVERMSDLPERPCVGDQGPLPDVCPADCCPSGRTMRSS